VSERAAADDAKMTGSQRALQGGSMPTIHSLELPLLDTGGERLKSFSTFRRQKYKNT
jgi:hypothetical protein